MTTCRRGHERDDSIINCPTCRKLRYEKNRSRELESNRLWIADNRKQYQETAKRYRNTNKNFVQQSYKSWEKKNPIHCIWRGMKRRCYNPNSLSYHLYGGRGVTICERWLGDHGYKNFEHDMGSRPSPKHSIDRKDPDGNYEPSNCRWATKQEQQRNRRANRLLIIGGVSKCLTAWAEEYNLEFNTLNKRIKNGWPESKLLIPADGRYRTSGRTGMRKVVAVSDDEPQNY